MFLGLRIMQTKYYGWVNTKLNIMFGSVIGGEWKEINFFKYHWLKINGFVVKKEGVQLCQQKNKVKK